MSKKYFILIYFLSLIISSSAQAYDYDPLLIRAQATIFPKIILLDKDLDKKIKTNEIIILVLHSRQEKDIAIQLKNLIEQQYKNNLGKQKLTINIKNFNDFNESSIATAYFLLKGDEESRKKVTTQAINQNRIAFSYDYKDFSNNTLISVLVKEKTYIYLNKSAIHDYDIKFLPLFYKIVKVIE